MTRTVVQKYLLLGALLVLLSSVLFLTSAPTQEPESTAAQENAVTLPIRPPEGYRIPSQPAVVFPYTHVSADRLRLGTVRSLPRGEKVFVIYPDDDSDGFTSPDSQWLLSRSRDGISITRADGFGDNRVLFQPYRDSHTRTFSSNPVWSWDSTRVFYRVEQQYYNDIGLRTRDSDSWIESVDIATGEVTRHTDVRYNSDLHSYATARHPHDPVLYFEHDADRHVGTLNVGTYDGSAHWAVIRDIDPALNYFIISNHTLSPDRQMILVRSREGGLIYAVDGRGLLYEFISDDVPLGGFLANFRWSPDSTKLAYHQVIDIDGHTGALIASELYLMNADGTGRVQLTDTPDIAEHLEGWTLDGHLVFSTRELERITPRGDHVVSEESDWHIADITVK